MILRPMPRPPQLARWGVAGPLALGAPELEQGRVHGGPVIDPPRLVSAGVVAGNDQVRAKEIERGRAVPRQTAGPAEDEGA